MSVLTYLKTQIERGQLREDTTQMAAAEKLDILLESLINYTPKRSIFSKNTPPPKGLYMWGGVGRGKSLIMDVFYDQIETKRKSRVHFHAFMQSVHSEINIWRKLSQKQRRKHKNYVRGAGDDPIAPTAKAIANEADILCFDEFHVTDIADAMLLSRLFTALFARGVVVIATSNREPDALYKDGLNRQLFLPFIAMLKDKLEVFDFDGDTDHRLRKLQRAPVYYNPLNAEAKDGIEKAWIRLTRPVTPQIKILNVQGRELDLLCASGTTRASFAHLCGRPLGAADYLEIARTFTTLVLENVPQMGPENRNEAKRFVTLIDALYEAKTKLVLSADAAPEDLYMGGDGVFEFERTASRLMEMRSAEYLGASHELIESQP
ncbi:MAG: cell division protein ZapE [Robiginitomaculum sp.]|nr:MAG: cell division protein ZapE [Robiginitomaculum sp.]